MKLELNEVFEYETLKWTITALVLNKDQQVVIFDAVSFNGSFYVQKRFTINQDNNNQTGAAA